MRAASLFLSLLAFSGATLAAPSLYPGADPGKAQASITESVSRLGNKAFTATYNTKGTAVTFGGLRAADGSALLTAGTPLFTIRLKDGTEFNSTNMNGSGLSLGENKPPKSGRKSRAARKAKEAAGQPEATVLHSRFEAPDGSFSVDWSGTLADGSHYLRHSLTIRSKKPLAISQITALDVNAAEETGFPTISGNTTHGCVAVNEKLFFGLETPMSLMTVAGRGVRLADSWTPEAWSGESFGPAFNMPASFRKVYGERYAATEGPVLSHLKQAEGPINFKRAGNCHICFIHKRGAEALHPVAVQLLSADGKLLSEDVHECEGGTKTFSPMYTVAVPQAGAYRLRYWVQTHSGGTNSRGRIKLSLPLAEDTERRSQMAANRVQGVWERAAELLPRQEWKVTGVVGLFAPGQKRRSFLAYVERERAVPYHPFVHYNDWYEIGIRVHDNKDPRKRTSESMWMKVLDVWQREMAKKRRTKLDGFILDDGWDDFNSLWDFHCGFPNGFAKLAQKARKQGAGMGTWLGPVGGYGSSKQMRLAYWNSKHPRNKIDNFQLSNEEYFNAFVDRCRQMIENHGVRYFKFDGISTKFHAKGPANIEDAEGILSVIAALRDARQDVFINTTVGTWASPFWYMHADSVWRQENDFGQVGNAGDERDRWITYRDRLVHEVFVEGAPLFPINSLMTHGTIITKNGPPHVMSRDPENCRKEMRMAFGCGSALQEIYADTDLMGQQGGVLWDELAACIAWVRRNADVLPDVHWVGGNPWDGKDGSIYGFAAWNKQKATLTLRNSSAEAKTLTTTLREVLDVPPGVTGSVTFRQSFPDQRELGLTAGALDVDAPITITMEPLEVIVLEGTCSM